MTGATTLSGDELIIPPGSAAQTPAGRLCRFRPASRNSVAAAAGE
jgi:hypothetical protein